MINEPIRNYAPGDADRDSLKKKLIELSSKRIEIPCIIAGKEVRTGNIKTVSMPHSHGEVLADFHWAGPKELKMAADAALKAKAEWELVPWRQRAAIFSRAGDLLAGEWRDTINAATMLGQSKNAYQAEIDAACELIDFLRFNAHFYEGIVANQPISVPGVSNRMDYRALEGFVFAITPFNFTAIAGNLCAAPAMLGNAVVWKPSDTQVYSAYYTMKLFEAAGVPPGVINFVPADGPIAGESLLKHPDLAGVHFTGSTATFRHIWKTVGQNIENYKTYPRLVGETGGKDFIFAHSSADLDVLTTALVRGAFEFQGQKCSAASRAYIPKSIWAKVRPNVIEQIRSIKMGDVRDFRNFVNAVIDARSYQKIMGYANFARDANDAQILAGGKGSDAKGYFVEPTLIETDNPKFRTMEEEIFGPVLTVYPYEDSQAEEALGLCASTSPYALTGAILAQDKAVVERYTEKLRYAAGNFYINDKPTGAVVGQQPFGGGRASGTNDKAGSYLNLVRWLSPRTIKENLAPPKSYSYPFMQAE